MTVKMLTAVFRWAALYLGTAVNSTKRHGVTNFRDTAPPRKTENSLPVTYYYA